MSGGGDYAHEMRKPRPLSDESVEAFFAGKPIPGEEGLTAFARSVRALATAPVPLATGELVRILNDGLTIDGGVLPVAAASEASGPRSEASWLPRWRRPLVATSSFIAAAFTKVGVASAAAKTGLAAAAAAGAVTAGAAAGVLPAPVQNAVSHAVGAILPVQLPTDSSGSATPSSVTVPTSGQAPVSVPAGAQPASPGSRSATGLSTADSTPAAGHAHTSVSTPANPGAQPSGPPASPGSRSATGPSTADSTPAAGHVPTSVSAPTDPGSRSTSHPSGAPSGAASQSSSGTSGSATPAPPTSAPLTPAPVVSTPVTSVPAPSGTATTGSGAASTHGGR